MTRPLEHIRVLDLCLNGPGFMTTMILGDFGADVIRVERPLPPDEYRAIVSGTAASPFAFEQYGPSYSFNRNKRSIVIDLKRDAGRDVLVKLVQEADVLVEGFRPGVADRLGIGYPALAAANDRLIYCSLSGYGQTGPYRDLPGHDLNYIALAGALSLLGDENGRPVVPGFQLSDFGGAAMHALAGILLALVARQITGKGQHVDISYADATIGLLGSLYARMFDRGEIGRPGLDLSGRAPFYNIYEAGDGKWLTVGCLEEHIWRALCRTLGLEQFAECRLDRSRYGEMRAAMQRVFQTRTRDEWFAICREAGVSVAPVLGLDEVPHDPQIQARTMFLDDVGADGKQIGAAIKLSRTPARGVERRPPRRGENTAQILREIGLSEAAVAELRQNGIVQEPATEAV